MSECRSEWSAGGGVVCVPSQSTVLPLSPLDSSAYTGLRSPLSRQERVINITITRKNKIDATKHETLEAWLGFAM